MTVHNLHTLFLLNEFFKIKKFRYPISLRTFKKNTFDSVGSGKMDNIVAPKYTLVTSRHQFLYCGSKTWNKMNEKTIKLGINVLSDFSISSYIAKRFKNIILGIQSSGNPEHWDKTNFTFE